MGRLLEVVERDDWGRMPAASGENGAASFREASLLVASDVIHGVRVARAYADGHVDGRPIVLVVAHAGSAGEPLTLYPSRRTLPPELSVVAGRARRVLWRAGLDHAVLSVPFVESEDGATRSRRITSALLEACRRFRARELVIDELAYWQPGTPRVALGLQAEAEAGRLGRTELVVTTVPATHGSTASRRAQPSRRSLRRTVPAARRAPERSAVAC